MFAYMKRIWLASGIIGIWTAVVFVSSIRLFSVDNALSFIEFVISVISPSFGVILFSKRLSVSMLTLIGVAYLTLVIPILGPSFGGTGKENILLFGLMGLCGGLVWGTPIGILGYLLKRPDRENP